MLAMLRNLGKMTALGLFEEGNENCLNTAVVVSKLTKVEMLQKARIHPMKACDYNTGSLQVHRPQIV